MTTVEAVANEALEIAKAAREDARMALDAWKKRQLADNKLLNDVLEAQREHSELLRNHGQQIGEMQVRLDRLEEKVDEGFSKMAKGMHNIEALLTKAEREN